MTTYEHLDNATSTRNDYIIGCFNKLSCRGGISIARKFGWTGDNNQIGYRLNEFIEELREYGNFPTFYNEVLVALERESNKKEATHVND